MNKVLKFIILFAILIFVAIFIYPAFRRSSENGTNLDLKISTSTINLPTFQNSSTTSEDISKTIKPLQKSSNLIPPIAKPKILEPVPVKEISSKSFEELINSSVIQLYCGYFNEETTFSDISRGTGIIIDEKGEILTNRHIIYDENSKKIRSDCFVLKSPFPNEKSQNPKIYYAAEIISYPAIEKFSDSFSKDKYYNDFAILKIISKPDSESKINLLLGFNYASPDDYSVLESSSSTFNFLPFDWNYQPKDGDALITLGYGVDASHNANKITSTIGKLSGNIDINESLKPQILLIESNATAGFSGGALINPQSKGLVGLISWITSGDETGKYTVAIFRDFLRDLMLHDLSFELK
ncbi:MAG: trypsin-like peptidase domain-containing protein [Candidatus Azambacteria bacterium]|nr:trypsin-like peptidase domain-containing protein [Candidatus Azambacteria bacterium]